MAVRHDPLGPNGGRPIEKKEPPVKPVPIAADADSWLFRGFSGIISSMHQRCLQAKDKTIPPHLIESVEDLIDACDSLYGQSLKWEPDNGNTDQFDSLAELAFAGLAFLMFQRRDSGINIKTRHFEMLRAELGRLRELATGMKVLNDRVKETK